MCIYNWIVEMKENLLQHCRLPNSVCNYEYVKIVDNKLVMNTLLN